MGGRMNAALVLTALLLVPATVGCLGGGQDVAKTPVQATASDPAASANWTLETAGAFAVPIEVTGPNVTITMIAYRPQTGLSNLSAGLAIHDRDSAGTAHSASRNQGQARVEVAGSGTAVDVVRSPEGEPGTWFSKGTYSWGALDGTERHLVTGVAAGDAGSAPIHVWINGTNVTIGEPTTGPARLFTDDDWTSTVHAGAGWYSTGPAATIERQLSWQTQHGTVAMDVGSWYLEGEDIARERVLKNPSERWHAQATAATGVEGDSDIIGSFDLASSETEWTLTTEHRLGAYREAQTLLVGDVEVPIVFEDQGTLLDGPPQGGGPLGQR